MQNKRSKGAFLVKIEVAIAVTRSRPRAFTSTKRGVLGLNVTMERRGHPGIETQGTNNSPVEY